MAQDFLKLYKEYCEEVTDSHPNYHDFVGIATVGVILGNGCYLPFGDTRIYPNIWLILLGDSSFARKTTALNIGKRLLSEVSPAKIYPNEFSHEKIQSLLEEKPAGCFYFSEFLSLMGLLSRDYMVGTKGFLADLFDCPYAYKRETGGRSINIVSPAISIMSATTQSWFTEKMKESDIQGGFLPRFLMILPKPKTKSLALPPPADKDKRQVLVDMLKNIQHISGVCFLKEEARKMFEDFYAQLSRMPGNGRTQPFLQRLQIYALKFAIIYNVMDEMSLKISASSMFKSIGKITELCKSMTTVEDEDMVFGKVQGNMRKISQYLKKHGDSSKSTLLMNTRLSSREFNEAIETLTESEKVSIQKIKTTKRPLTIYSLIETTSE
jgi:hypothetical protein